MRHKKNTYIVFDFNYFQNIFICEFHCELFAFIAKGLAKDYLCIPGITTWQHYFASKLLDMLANGLRNIWKYYHMDYIWYVCFICYRHIPTKKSWHSFVFNMETITKFQSFNYYQPEGRYIQSKVVEQRRYFAKSNWYDSKNLIKDHAWTISEQHDCQPVNYQHRRCMPLHIPVALTSNRFLISKILVVLNH